MNCLHCRTAIVRDPGTRVWHHVETAMRECWRDPEHTETATPDMITMATEDDVLRIDAELDRIRQFIATALCGMGGFTIGDTVVAPEQLVEMLKTGDQL